MSVLVGPADHRLPVVAVVERAEGDDPGQRQYRRVVWQIQGYEGSHVRTFHLDGLSRRRPSSRLRTLLTARLADVFPRLVSGRDEAGQSGRRPAAEVHRRARGGGGGDRRAEEDQLIEYVQVDQQPD